MDLPNENLPEKPLTKQKQVLPVRLIKGDLLLLAEEGKFDAIAHGCNCFHTMGAGIAAQVRQRFPASFAADKKTPYGDIKKLGTHSVSTFRAKTGKEVRIYNLYTQFRYGRAHGAENQTTRYEAIRSALKSLATLEKGSEVGLPLIGAGLAGGDWPVIKGIIQEILPGCTVVVWEKQ